MHMYAKFGQNIQCGSIIMSVFTKIIRIVSVLGGGMR